MNMAHVDYELIILLFLKPIKALVFIKHMNDWANKKIIKNGSQGTIVTRVGVRQERQDGSIWCWHCWHQIQVLQWNLVLLMCCFFGGEWEWSETWNKLVVALFWYCITGKHWELKSNKLNVAAISTFTKTGPFGDRIAWVPVTCEIITLCSFMQHSDVSQCLRKLPFTNGSRLNPPKRAPPVIMFVFQCKYSIVIRDFQGVVERMNLHIE